MYIIYLFAFRLRYYPQYVHYILRGSILIPVTVLNGLCERERIERGENNDRKSKETIVSFNFTLVGLRKNNANRIQSK